MIKVINKNLFLFCFGFCIYIAIEVIFRGYSYPASGLMGGLAIALIDKINDKISWDIDLIIQAIIGSCLITFMELILGLLFLNFDWIPIMWDYSNMPLNYKGIICLPFSLLWMLLSVVAIFLADAINYYFLNECEVPHYIIFGKYRFSFPQ